MAVGFFHALGLGAAQQGDKMADVGMDIAVRQQAQEVEGFAARHAVGYQLFPGIRCEQGAVFDGFAHQLCTLRVDLTAAEGVVADLGVAHIVVAGQTDRRAVGLEPGVGAGIEKTVQVGRLCHRDSITAAAVALADAVHNH